MDPHVEGCSHDGYIWLARFKLFNASYIGKLEERRKSDVRGFRFLVVLVAHVWHSTFTKQVASSV